MTVTRSIAALLVVVGAGCAQDKEGKARRLESVTWNSVKHELTWVVANGDKKESGKFEAKDQQSYRIDMDGAMMNYNGEVRGFSKEEARRVHQLMDLVANYAIESTVWWDAGHGLKIDPPGGDTPDAPRRKKNVQPTTVAAGYPGAPSTEEVLRRRISELEARVNELEWKNAELSDAAAQAIQAPLALASAH